MPAFFLAGYQAAIDEPELARLIPHLETVPPEHRGFAYEGAAMGLGLLDALLPGRARRVDELLAGAGGPHVYMVLAGVGVGWARLPGSPDRRRRRRLDPLLGWLAIDGTGFHEGFFHPRRAFVARRLPRRLTGYARSAFDQGLGRSLWFVEGADSGRIAAVVEGFAPERRADLWSGVGLAACYAGAGDPAALVAAAGGHRPALAQGAAFAAKARVRAGWVPDYTRRATEIFTARTAEQAARLTDDILEGLPPDAEVPAFEVWRRQLQVHLASEPGERRWTSLTG